MTKRPLQNPKVGDKILLTNEDRKTKLRNPFIGPFPILEIISDVNIKIQRIVHVNRTKKFEQIDSNSESND